MFGFLASSILWFAPATVPPNPARELLTASLKAMGPVTRLEQCSLKSLEICYLPEQSGAFRGAALWNLARRNETLNYASATISGQAELTGAQFETPFTEKYPPRPITRNGQDLQERLWLDPVILLRRAAAAADLRLHESRAVTFTWQNRPITIRFGGSDSAPLPSEIEWEGPRIEFWAAWAQVKNRTSLSNWQRLAGGLALPFTRRTSRNGIPVFDETILQAEPKMAESEVPLPSDPPPVVSPTMPLPSPKEIAPHLWQYPGVFPTEVYEDSDGLTLIDAANSPEFATLLLADVRQRFPKQELKRVIVTDPFWPHFGGLRTYAATGAEIVCSAGNQPQLAEILADPLAKHRPRFRQIRTVSRIGQMEILPLPGPETDRILAVFWPKSGVLFTSDTVIFRGQKKLYSEQMAREMVDAVTRVGWNPTHFFATHCPLRPWDDVFDVLRDCSI